MTQASRDKHWTEILEMTDWAKLSHAYGPATDTPGHLRALLEGDINERKAAESHLVSAIIHQGTPWSATAPVALIVTGWLNDEAIARSIQPIREGLFAFLAELASFFEQFEDDDWERLKAMVSQAPVPIETVTEWSEIESSEELTNAYFSMAALVLLPLRSRIFECLPEDER